MKENDMHIAMMAAEEPAIDASDAKALRALEGGISSEACLDEALDDENSMQACALLSDMAVAMRMEKQMPELDVERELAAFHSRHGRQPGRRWWPWAAAGVAAAVAVMWLLMLPVEKEPEPLLVFKADTARQEIVLKAGEQHRPMPLADLPRQVPGSRARVSGMEINYTTEKIDEAIAQNKAHVVHTLSIPRGETFKVVLSDSTEVWLNAESRLAYPPLFGGDKRVVSLEGEAYFKVAHDAAHPFVVISGDMRIQVLGTEFNVRRLPSGHSCVTLIDGRVEVGDVQGQASAVLQPGESASILADGTIDRKMVDLDAYIYWKEGFFYFDNVTLADMMKEIGCWYNVDVEFLNREVMDTRMHFFADRRKKIPHTIEMLNRMNIAHASYDGRKITIE